MGKRWEFVSFTETSAFKQLRNALDCQFQVTLLGYTFIITIAKSLKQTNNVFHLIILFNKYKIVLYVLTIQYLYM